MNLSLGRYEDAVQRRFETLARAGAPASIWQRDPSFWSNDSDVQRLIANRLGWLDVTAQMRARVPEIERFAEQVRAAGFTDAVVLGMGGSSLAPEVLRQSLAGVRRSTRPALHVLDTTDPATIDAVVRRIDVAHTLFFVSSKSGTTIEALSLFAYFHELVRAQVHERAGENFAAITDDGTPLQALAAQHGFRHVFTNPGDIGGRYSALSYFGLVPAAVAGIDVGGLLDRGIAAVEAAKAPGSDALRLGAVLGEMALAGRDKCTFIISPRIASFGLWVEQLIAESTGKLGRGILLVAEEPMGTPPQYGDDRFFVQIRLAGDSDGQNDAATGALRAAGFPVVTIDLDEAYDLGREFFAWEFAVAVAGQVLGINPFDEPNVQESKDNTSRVLKEFEQSGRLDIDGLAESGLTVIAGGTPAPQRSLAGVLSELMESLGEHDYFAITAYVQPTQRTHDALQGIRAAVRDARRVATTLGYGPRFLHSTGQLHKGGPPRGVFLQITAGDSRDTAVSGRPFTFGQLKRAQAIGDFQSLVSHGRPVVRVHIGGDVDAGLETLREAVETIAEATATAKR